jgi:hypothetical protein
MSERQHPGENAGGHVSLRGSRIRCANGVVMAFNPLDHSGIPLERQVRSWRELNVAPIDPDRCDPYTRCRVITMNGIEVEAILFNHHLARHCPDLELRRRLAEVRYRRSSRRR